MRSLSIKQAVTEDVGLYSIEATNEVGEASSSAHLNVLGISFHTSNVSSKTK